MLGKNCLQEGHIESNKGRIRIGTTQKVLNLYLKYLWVLNKIPEPPHCPFDGIIIDMMELNEPIRWTKFDDIDVYNKLINKVKDEKMTVAEWELGKWNNR